MLNILLIHKDVFEEVGSMCVDSTRLLDSIEMVGFLSLSFEEEVVLFGRIFS